MRFDLILNSKVLVVKNMCSFVCCKVLQKSYPSSISKSLAIFNFTFPASTVTIQMQSEKEGYFSLVAYPGELIVPGEEPLIVSGLKQGS